MKDGIVAGSFRDPGGFVFRRHGVLYRQIQAVAKDDYQLLMESGLYADLCARSLLIPHEEVGAGAGLDATASQVIRPQPLRFVSYPYEWCFSQLQDAALVTLQVQRQALAHGMSLKDASAYNVQWHEGRMLLIDTLSFTRHADGEPWVAYRQFCQHFLAPLALMSYVDVRLSQLLRVHLDGIPLDLASRLLPWRSRLRFGLLAHVHLHARSQQHFATRQPPAAGNNVGASGLLGLIDNLESLIRSLRWHPQGTEWADYYSDTHYSDSARATKAQIVGQMLGQAGAREVWDLGANTGVFSRLASKDGVFTVAFDMDPAAVEQNYQECRRQQESSLLPLLLDLANPSPGLGWAHGERVSWLERGPTGTVMALALIHHLAISNNLPLPKLAQFFHGLGEHLILEWVPKEDEKVRFLLAGRNDVFPEYNEEELRRSFAPWFTIQRCEEIPGTARALYLMQRRTPA